MYSAHKFSDTCISQGNVAMHFRCGGIFNDYFIANFPESVSVKGFCKSVNIGCSYDKNSVVYFFLTMYNNLIIL